MATKITKVKRVFITGSKGFIGNHLTNALLLLKKSYDFFDYDIVIGSDILDYKDLFTQILVYQPDAIVHLAAISSLSDVDESPTLALRTNIEGTYNVLRAAAEAKIKKVIVASSAAVEAITSEELSLYGITKSTDEMLVHLFEDSIDELIIARFNNVYGPGSKSVVNKFMESIKRGEPITLNGDTIRDYVYIDDVVDALIELIDEEWFYANHVKYIGTATKTSLSDLVSIIEKVLGKKALVRRKDPIKEIQISALDPLRWDGSGKTKLEDGIRRML